MVNHAITDINVSYEKHTVVHSSLILLESPAAKLQNMKVNFGSNLHELMEKIQVRIQNSKATPWYKALLQKLIVVQLVKKFVAFYETRMFIVMFTTSRHWSLS